MHNKTIIRTLILTAIVAACGGDPSGASESPLTPAEFVEVVVEIREAEREVAAEDSAAQLFDERTGEILDRHGTTEAELRAFVAANAENLALLEQVWDTINARLTLTPPNLEPVEEEGGPEQGVLEEAAPDELGEEGIREDPPGPPRRVLPMHREGERRPVIR